MRLPYIPALDGIRAVAILMVLGIHLGFGRYPGGILGVNVFFVLSGFLITSLLLREHAMHGAISLRRFYWGRARRLLPALMVTVVACAALVAAMPALNGAIAYPAAALATMLYTSNWVQAWNDESLGMLSHTWSLALEEQFYVIWPLALIYMLTRAASARRLLLVIATIAVCSFAFAAFGSAVGAAPYFNTASRAGELMVGCALGVVVARAPHSTALRVLGHPVSATVALLGILAAGLYVDIGDTIFYDGLAVVAIGAACLIAHCMTRVSWLTRLLAVAPLTYLGRLSYGVYLYHLPVVYVVSPERYALSAVEVTLLRVALIAVVSVASFHLIESPIRRWAPTWAVARRPA
jgi:peptidoglycan/LPS O-acetylase OafA/YrhL